MAKNTHECLVKKPIKIFLNYLNISGAGAGENVNLHPCPICYAGRVKLVH